MLSNSFTSEEYQDDEDLKCPKCLSFFSSNTKPYILPCNHNICLNCVDTLISEKNTKCPICNFKFSEKDRNSLEVNFGFLNLVIKILQTKIIFCSKCNKIFYWKEHYQSCEQKYFENGNNILDELKTTCEDSVKILKLIKTDGDLLNKYKNEVGNLIKFIMNEIHKKCEDNLKDKINNELFNIKIDINFRKSKTEILNFMKLCLPYPQFFNTREIRYLLDFMSFNETKIAPLITQKNKRKINNKSSFSPSCFNLFFLTEEGINGKYEENKKYETIGDYNMKNKNNYNFNSFKKNYKTNRHKSTIYYNEQDKNSIISEESDDDFLMASNCDDERIKESDRIKVKTYHDNNISKFKKLNTAQNINILNKNKNNNHQNKTSLLKNNVLFKTQRAIKKTAVKIYQEKKKNKFDINKLLDEDMNIDEPQTQNKIIVGLKDVKIISLRKNVSTENNSVEKIGRVNSKLIKSNIINSPKLIEIDNENSLKIIRKKNKINNNFNTNNNNLNLTSKTIQIETPSLKLLRSSDYSKREFHSHINSNSNITIDYNSIKNKNSFNNSTGFNNISNTINVDHSIAQNFTRTKLINNPKNINNNCNTIIRENNIISMNKIIKNFNKMRDLTNKLKFYNELINFLTFNINNDVRKNIIILKNLIMKNYELLLNEISYSSSNIQKNYVLFPINNSYNLLLYDPFNRKYYIKNYSQIFYRNKIDINPFNKSISIVYDNNDLIFISGGDYCYNLFIIISWSNGKLFHKESLPTKKAYHKTIYFNEILYLIGGVTTENKVSSECFFFNLKEKKWNSLPNLNIPRKNSSICLYNSSILYVFRGEDDNNVLDSIEYINIQDKKEWNLIKPIDNGYVWFPAKNSMVIAVDKDKIIICGGEDNEGQLYQDCFLFEPSSNCIYKGLDLVTPAAFISEGCIYQDEIYGIDYKNSTKNHKPIIHSCNIKKNFWNFCFIK